MNYLENLAACSWAMPTFLAQTHSGIQAGQQPLAPPQGIDLVTVVLATGTVAFVLLMAMIVSSLVARHQRRAQNDPRRLLKQLCEAHGFRRWELRLLQAAARALSVQQPARFFLEPKLFAQATEHPALASRRDDLYQIAGELFGPMSPE